jgi:DNA polymerase III epsilon subunit-like protein
MSRLSDKSLRKLAGCVEELIEEQEDAEDVAHIEALTPYDYENAIPFEDIVKEFEAEHGSLHQN